MKLHSRPGGHFYSEKKVLYPSVTTILHQIPNPGLEKWKRYTPNWRKVSAAACLVGTAVHKDIENALNHKLKSVRHQIPFQAFLNWDEKYHLMPIRTELKVKSVCGYAGSLDIAGIIENALYIIDIKTSSRIYENFLLQLSAYKAALIEMGETRHIDIAVLRLDKYSGKYDWKVYTDAEYQEGITEFLALCETWHKKNNVEEQFSKKFVLEE